MPDVGCGTGTLAILAKTQAGASVELHGQDASPQMIARQKAAQAGVNIDFRPALVEAIDAPDNSLDLVLSSLMVHHLPGDLKAKAFGEIYRVLKPGGRVFNGASLNHPNAVWLNFFLTFDWLNDAD